MARVGRYEPDVVAAAEKLVEIGLVAAGSGVPMASAFALLRAVFRRRDRAAVAFAQRLVAEVREWCDRSERVQRLGGLPSGWQERLVAHLASVERSSLSDAGEAAALLAEVVFVPLIAGGDHEEACRELAVELAGCLPDLVLRAGDELGLLAAMRAVLEGRLEELEDALQAAGLHMDPDNPRHRVGEIEPLSFPEDVSAVIDARLGDHPGAAALRAWLAADHALARQATNPLLCTMWCLMAQRDRLPVHRLELFGEVVGMLAAGTWRPAGHDHDEVAAAEHYLRELAWEGAANDPVSGLGVWRDEVIASRPADPGLVRLVDNVAPRAGPTPPGRTAARRFVHRSLREYLVARHLATLPAPTVADLLVPHLWCDQDWAAVLPMAVAAHPDPSAVLRRVLDTVGSVWATEPFHAVVDLLAAVAGEMDPDRFDPDMTQIIDQARVRAADDRWYEWDSLVLAGSVPGCAACSPST